MADFTGDWSDVASGWDHLRAGIEETNRVATDALLGGLALAPGERVLELGGGNGELAARLAALVGPTGSLLASDVAAGMVALIRSRTAGLDNVEVQQIDACDIDLPAASFDAVVFRMGLMLVPDPDAALRHVRRVLRAGGRFGATVWGDPEHNPWIASVRAAAMLHGVVPEGAPVASGNPLALNDPDALEELSRNAGFADVAVQTIDYVRRFATVDEHFDMVRMLSGSMASAFAAAPAEKVAAVRDTVDELTAQYRDGDALELPARAIVLVAS